MLRPIEMNQINEVISTFSLSLRYSLLASPSLIVMFYVWYMTQNYDSCNYDKTNFLLAPV